MRKKAKKSAPVKRIKRFRADPALKKFVHECLDRAERNMALDRWHGEILYHKHEGKNDEYAQVYGMVVAADIRVNRRYLTYTLNIYPSVQKLWKNGEKGEVEKVLHHEMAHLNTQHLMDMAVSTYKDEGETKDAWESLTETMGRMSMAMTNLRARTNKK